MNTRSSIRKPRVPSVPRMRNKNLISEEDEEEMSDRGVPPPTDTFVLHDLQSDRGVSSVDNTFVL